ncbi:hypothetical protein HXX02_00260 [Microbulbifer elongatus]|uniref:Lipoprotein n=1 Tax=Microbulbifer elongatus TaxID=86173 RepID=A0ABT1NVI8_9GAMM|nr:hypothetical protein [Microbulbifer elongatus]MCQ3827868.1 hypothetical protein [Microbulbifer elongatus]
MRYLVFIVLGLISACSATQPGLFKNQDFDVFEVKGESYGISRNEKYYLFLDDELLSDSTKSSLLKYGSYILDYRGMRQTLVPDEADYYVLVSFRPYDETSKEQVFQISGGSRKVFEVTNEFRPRWWISSTYLGERPKHDKMIPMHAISVRDFLGASRSGMPQIMKYRRNDVLVRHVVEKVEQ